MKKIKDLLRCIMLLYKRMLFFIAKITTKTDEKAVFFESFQGRSFACSPKAMYLQMQQDDKYKDFSFFWGLRKTDIEDFNNKKNTQLVKFESYSYYKALAKAKYWIVNSNTRAFLKPGKKHVFVQTWHGTPLKKIGCDITCTGNAMTKYENIQKIYDGEAEKITYMISPSQYCTEKFISAFDLKKFGKEDAVLTVGYPRNDYLFKFTDDECKNIKLKLNIPMDKKVILYAPTFRDNKYSAKDGFKIQNFMNFDKMRDKFGENCVILFRAHYFISGRIDFSKYAGFVYDVSNVEDVNELYVISDILITDYSSVFFDYANLKRPIIFYMYDYEEYKNELRDFYIDVNELPGRIVRDENELSDAIEGSLNDFNVDNKYLQFNNKFNYLDGSDSSRRALEKIID